MNSTLPPPPVAPLDEGRLAARQAHLEREVALPAPRHARRRLVRGGIIAAAALAAAAVLLTGRGSEPDATAKALAALTRGPYLGIEVHVGGRGSSTLIHLDDHSSERLHSQVEIWFDTEKHGRSTNVGGCIRLVGPTTRSGCIGTVLTLSDSVEFTGSIDRYRDALATGRVQKTGSAIVRGRHAWWLRIAPKPASGFLTRGWASYVAVDQKTGSPLRIESRKGRQIRGRADIDVLPETHALPRDVLPTARTNLAVPPPQSTHRMRSSAVATLAEADRSLPGALWPGKTAAGQPFRRARILTLRNGKKQLELLYGGDCPDHCVLVKEGTEAGWAPLSRLYTELPDRSILVNGGRYADGRSGRVVIRLEGTSKAAVLATARALRPFAP